MRIPPRISTETLVLRQLIGELAGEPRLAFCFQGYPVEQNILATVRLGVSEAKGQRLTPKPESFEHGAFSKLEELAGHAHPVIAAACGLVDAYPYSLLRERAASGAHYDKLVRAVNGWFGFPLYDFITLGCAVDEAVEHVTQLGRRPLTAMSAPQLARWDRAVTDYHTAFILSSPSGGGHEA